MNVPRAFRDRVEFDPSFKAFPPSDPTEDDEPSTPVSLPPVRPDAARRSWRSDSDESGEGVQRGCMRDPSLPKIGKALMSFGPIAIRWVGDRVDKTFVRCLVGFLVATFLLGSFGAAAAGSVPMRMLVGYRGDLGTAWDAIRSHGGSIDFAYRNFPLVAATVPAGAQSAIASARGITFVEPVMARFVTSHIVEGEL